jgi:membrane-associated phospholipid phosphatase
MIHDAPPPQFSNRTVLLFCAAAVLGGFFVVWTWLALDPTGALEAFDVQVAIFWREHAGGQARAANLLLTDLGGVATNLMVALMGAVWQLSHGRRRFAAAWIAVVLGNGVMNQAFKVAFDRDRPPEPDSAVVERNKSYPSGHAMGGTVGYGMVCYALLRQSRFPLRRTALMTLFVMLIVGIGFSRIYLRAHWFSDVIGGYAAGLGWLCLCVGFLERGWPSSLQTSPRSGP